MPPVCYMLDVPANRHTQNIFYFLHPKEDE